MEQTTTDVQFEKKKTIYRTYQVVWYILGVIEVLLGLRLLLRFLGANPGNTFADLIYALSGVFAWPFYTLFGPVEAGRSVLEISTIFAMLIYWLLAWGIVKVLQIRKPATKEEVVEKVDDPKVRL